jgi:hypothetical protein
MPNIFMDTKTIYENGKEIMRLATDLNDLLISLYDRLTIMPEKTLEWTGPSAYEFVRRLNVEKKDYFIYKDNLYQYGKILSDMADRFEKVINLSVEKLD